MQISKTFDQINHSRPEVVFPLLCPVREKDWLEGWEYRMIFSKSGLIEQGCIFATPHHGKEETLWYVTHHDQTNFHVEFIRFTPNEELVKINIQLYDNGEDTTRSNITYQYTALNQQKMVWMAKELDEEFEKNMIWWEKSINYYLEKGEKLVKKNEF